VARAITFCIDHENGEKGERDNDAPYSSFCGGGKREKEGFDWADSESPLQRKREKDG